MKWIRTACLVAAMLPAALSLAGCDVLMTDQTEREDVHWKQIVIGGRAFGDYACGLSDDGRTWCWGRNVTGYTGAVFGPDNREPVAVNGAPQFVQLAATGNRTCGLTSNGEAWCWGDITSEQDEVPVTVPTPTRVESPMAFQNIVAAAYHTCGLTSDGDVYCWNWRDETPSRLQTDTRFAQLAGGGGFLCGLNTDHRVYCWGVNDVHQLGTGTRDPSDTPVPVKSMLTFQVVASDFERSCALDMSGSAYCWGKTVGYPGSPGLVGGFEPTEVHEGGTYIDIAVGRDHVCALTASGSAECWGDNFSGALGDGTRVSRSGPAPVTGDHRFTDIAAGGDTSCGITPQGDVWCWGGNEAGELGNGQSYGSGNFGEDNSPHPVKVLDPAI